MIGLAAASVATTADAHYDHSLFSYDSSHNKMIDPVTFVMYGTGATALATQDHVQFHGFGGPTINGNAGQYGKDHGNWTEFDRNNADGCFNCTRNHVRWNQGGDLGHDNYRYTVGTPHLEVPSSVAACGQGLIGEKHAVVSSGFAAGRDALRNSMPAHHARFYRDDGSMTRVRQCDGGYVGGDGLVLWMRLDPS